jgi:cysteinyl-tRNA synthetase
VLRLFDTASRSVRPLELRDPGSVSMYVCGVTVSDRPHIGHGRMALVFDILRRYLVASGLAVRFVSNITDVDDKIIARAEREGRTEQEVAQEYEASWWRATDALGVLRPDAVPHATQYVGRMVELVAELVRKGMAYETSTGVYLDVERVDGYGLLAHQPLDSLRPGARVDVDPEKRSPLDFDLWKRARPNEPTWESPFGPGRPGWHTECVAMSLDLLGEDFDLHGGGIDLSFPHHENERAQAVALGRRFARHWVHNGRVMVGSEKMSKSLENFVTVDELVAQADPRAYRLLVLRSQYRSPIEVSAASIDDAQRGLDRLDAMARRFELVEDLNLATSALPPEALEEGDLVEAELVRFAERMDDDLDSPGALAGIFDAVGRANAMADRGNHEAAAVLARTVVRLCAVLGLPLRGGAAEELDQHVRELAAARDAARAAGDYERSDAIRRELVALGWRVEDTPRGTTLRRERPPSADGASSSPAEASLPARLPRGAGRVSDRPGHAARAVE